MMGINSNDRLDTVEARPRRSFGSLVTDLAQRVFGRRQAVEEVLSLELEALPHESSPQGPSPIEAKKQQKVEAAARDGYPFGPYTRSDERHGDYVPIRYGGVSAFKGLSLLTTMREEENIAKNQDVQGVVETNLGSFFLVRQLDPTGGGHFGCLHLCLSGGTGGERVFTLNRPYQAGYVIHMLQDEVVATHTGDHSERHTNIERMRRAHLTDIESMGLGTNHIRETQTADTAIEIEGVNYEVRLLPTFTGRAGQEDFTTEWIGVGRSTTGERALLRMVLDGATWQYDYLPLPINSDDISTLLSGILPAATQLNSKIKKYLA